MFVAMIAVVAGLAQGGAPAPAPDLLEEIESQFPAAKKWFGMVADLQWDRQPDGALTPRLETLRSSFVLARDPAGQSLQTRLPPFSSGPLTVWLTGDDGLRVRTREDGIATVPAEVLRGVVVYRGAVLGGDLLYKVTPTHVDEYVYLRAPPAGLRRTFEFDYGGKVAGLRQAGRVIELLGKDGAAHLRLSAPVARAADGTRRTGTVRLEGARLIEELDLRGLKPPVLVDPDWSTTGTMTVAHWADHAWQLTDGTVMAAGGCALASCPLGLATSSCNQVLPSTDVWNPGSGTWAAGPPLLTARYSYAAAVLPGNELLIAGGCTSSGCATTTAAAERYSKAQQQWVEAGVLPSPRANVTAAVLPGGDVLVPGGCTAQQCLTDVARYQVATNRWLPAAPLPSTRGYATTTALADGSVLVIGGCADATCATVLADAVRFDPLKNEWRFAGIMGTPRGGHTATLLDDGTVLVTGGCAAQPCRTSSQASSEVWQLDALGGAFTRGPTMNAARHHHTATRLDNGQLLIAGGADLADGTGAGADLYLPFTRRFLKAPRMLMTRAYHVAVGLSSGKVLVAGGCNPATCLPWAEVFNPEGLPIETADAGASDAGSFPDPPPDPEPDLTPFRSTGGPHPKLFRTGVTSCATDEQQGKACPVPGWRGQDGDFQPNAHPMVPVTKDEVRDEATGLLWRAATEPGAHAWAEAADVCKAVAPAGSWRLPSVVELMTLNHYGKLGPSVDQAFSDTQSTNYWTSTAVAGSKFLAWTVKFDAGEVVPVLKDSVLPVRCVQGQSTTTPAGPDHLRLAGPFTATDRTVRDVANGLEWQRKDDGVKRTWRESLDHCAHLDLDGHKDWHLPNNYELLGLIEYGSAEPVKIDPLFQQTRPDLYWSSTFGEGLPSLEWSVTFNLGVIDGVTYSGRGYARCVRHLPTASTSSCRCAGGPAGAAAPWLAVALAVIAWRAGRRRAVRDTGR